MNKKVIRIGLVVMLVLALASACAPAAPSSPATGGAKGGLVYYLAPSLQDEFQAGTNKMMLEFGKQFGYDIRTVQAGSNAATQVNQMDDAISQKPKAIIIAAVDASTILGSVEKAREAGIAVLVFDRFIQDTPVDFTSVVGTIKMGQMGAAETVRLLTEKNGSAKGTVLQLMGDPGDTYSVTIDQGFSEAMKAYPDITVVTKPTPGWEVTTSASIVDDQLTANENIDLIFFHGDFRAPAIVSVLEAHGHQKGDVILIGTDGSPTGLQAIRDGWMTEDISVPMVEQVYALWQFLEDAVAKKPFTAGPVDVKGVPSELVNESWGPTLYLPGQIIDKANVDDPNQWGNMKVDVQQ
jgi:ribose transport system substrate-binding protein